MLDKNEEESILARAYIPEHIINLMCFISKGEPFLISDFICYSAKDWLIFVGYPLKGSPVIEKALSSAVEKFGSKHIFLIAPELPSSLLCQERKMDGYYKLGLEEFRLKKGLRYRIKRAERELRVEQGSISKEHEELISEFLDREKPDAYVENLFMSMPRYARRSKTSIVLNARDKKGNLSAFYLVDMAAKNFAAYLISCYSRRHYTIGASDILFYEMVKLALEKDKKYINLGLGVNEGIRKFKEKWGGVPFLKYETCSYDTGYTRALERFRAWGV